MTDLWLHVNTFFIIVLIFFGYGSHIKKYMAAYFICLRKLSFYSDDALKFVLLFLEFFLPGTVKAVPAKLCAAFLCTLLNRLRFSPQNVEFGTKRREICPLRRSRARFPLLSPAVTSSPGAGEVFPQRGSQGLRLVAKVLGIMEKFSVVLKPSPWGRWHRRRR